MNVARLKTTRKRKNKEVRNGKRKVRIWDCRGLRSTESFTVR